MAQKIVDFLIKATPVQSTSATIFTLASFDLAAMGGGIGNITDCVAKVRASITKFEVGGSTYAQSWEKLATFRRDTTGSALQHGSTTDGNAGVGGIVGDPVGADVIAFDNSTSSVRLRITPPTGTYWWWAKLMVEILQGA